jgi:hypothetical protein
VSQNWPNDPRLGCKTPFNFVEFIEKDKIIEEELEEFEGGFEREEIVDMNSLYIYIYIYILHFSNFF